MLDSISNLIAAKSNRMKYLFSKAYTIYESGNILWKKMKLNSHIWIHYNSHQNKWIQKLK